MLNKDVLFGKDAKQKILKGMSIIGEAVGSTLGPKGMSVVIERDGKPQVTKDGITVARSIQLADHGMNVGAQMLREATLVSWEKSGDGTTSSTVMALGMIEAYIQSQRLNPENPVIIKKQVEEAKKIVLDSLKESTIPFTIDSVEKIATISGNNDPEIGKLLDEAFRKITKDGVITVEESSSVNTFIDIIDGMQFDRGYVSHHFATDVTKGECILEKPYILITDQKIQLMRDIIPVLEIAVNNHKPILLIAQDYDDEVIQNLKINKLQGILQVCAIKAPSFGDYRKEVLEDIAILTNGKVATYESGILLSKVDESMLGTCSKVIVNRDNTTIIGGDANEEILQGRVQQIREELKNLPEAINTDFLRKFYEERIAKLTSGISIIHVGGATEMEMKERKDRVDDAVCATKAASEEGIVPGGGLVFLKAAEKIKDKKLPGYQIVYQALQSVTKKIIENAGYDYNELKNDFNLKEWIGFDADKEQFVSFIKRGIFDPAKCDRLVFENAIAVFELYISTNCLITNIDPKF